MKIQTGRIAAFFVASIALAGPVAAFAQDLQTADLGACALENGGSLKPCTVGYRTLGTLNEERDNAVLVATWFTGDSEGSVNFASNLVDTSEFFLIVVDALGNGVSTSPTNSPTQGGENFPRITIGDMVGTQYRLVTEVLGLDGFHAVMGASMGGMQTFEWIVAHPGFVKKAVPLIGSPKLGAYDVALWETQLRILDLYESCQCGDALAVLTGLGMLVGSTPERFDAETDPANVKPLMLERARAFMERTDGWTNDIASQLHAMIDHDVSRHFGGDLPAAAATIEADLLSVVVITDHIVTPWSAIGFVEMAGGENIVLDNPGGHGGIFAPGTGYEERVRAFLAESD